VLEQRHVAGKDGGNAEPEGLPEREVPGHDREHDAEGLVHDVALLCLGPDLFRFQELPALWYNSPQVGHFSTSASDSLMAFPISS
jgi:hypothetical protein